MGSSDPYMILNARVNMMINYDHNVNITIVCCVYDSRDVVTCYVGIMRLWLRLCVSGEFMRIEYILWLWLRLCVQSHDRGSFKYDEFMCIEYCDGIHYGNLFSLITLRRDELKIILRIIEESCFFYSS